MKKFRLLCFAIMFVSTMTVYAGWKSAKIELGKTKSATAFDVQMILDAEGYPMITYFNTARNILEFVRCESFDCTTVTPASFIDSRYHFKPHSISLDSEIRSHILYSYRNNATSLYSLALANCLTSDCTELSILRISNPEGFITGVADIDQNGTLYIAYKDDANGLFKLMICELANCENSKLHELIDASTMEPSIDLAIDADGNPRLAIVQNHGLKLTYLSCVVSDCSKGNLQTIDEGTEIIDNAEMVLDSSGNPIFAYYSQDDKGLMIAVCIDELCSQIEKRKLGDMVSGADISLSIDPDDHPVIAYINNTPGNAYLVTCADPTCQDSTTSRLDDQAQSISMVMRADNKPLIAVGAMRNYINVINCLTPSC